MFLPGDVCCVEITIAFGGGKGTRGAWLGPINIPFKIVSCEKRQKLSAPEKIVMTVELNKDEMLDVDSWDGGRGDRGRGWRV